MPLPETFDDIKKQLGVTLVELPSTIDIATVGLEMPNSEVILSTVIPSDYLGAENIEQETNSSHKLDKTVQFNPFHHQQNTLVDSTANIRPSDDFALLPKEMEGLNLSTGGAAGAEEGEPATGSPTKAGDNEQPIITINEHEIALDSGYVTYQTTPEDSRESGPSFIMRIGGEESDYEEGSGSNWSDLFDLKDFDDNDGFSSILNAFQ
jgi:hypothetical protein